MALKRLYKCVPTCLFTESTKWKFIKLSLATSLCFVLFSQPKLPTDFQSRFQAASDGAALMCNKVKNFPSDHSQSAGETNEIFHR